MRTAIASILLLLFTGGCFHSYSELGRQGVRIGFAPECRQIIKYQARTVTVSGFRVRTDEQSIVSVGEVALTTVPLRQAGQMVQLADIQYFHNCQLYRSTPEHDTETRRILSTGMQEQNRTSACLLAQIIAHGENFTTEMMQTCMSQHAA